MGLLDTMKGVLTQYASGTASPANLEADFQQLTQTADPGTLAHGIAAVMRSDQTPPFAQLVSQLFANGSGDQKADMLRALLGAAAPDQQGQIAAALAGAQGGQGTPSSDVIQSIAQRVEQSNPGAIDKMSSFYAQHPTLVKTLGSAAMMIAMRKIAERHAQNA
jgi:hypothetical protein